MKALVYREVWVSEDKDGRPLRSAINKQRLNDQAAVFRYVPADAVCSALVYLEDDKVDDAFRVLRSLVKR